MEWDDFVARGRPGGGGGPPHMKGVWDARRKF